VFEEELRTGLAVACGEASARVVEEVYLQSIPGEISLVAPTPTIKNRPVWALVIWKVLAVAERIAVQALGKVVDTEATTEEHEYHW
jgi:hypothetical protein